MAEAGQKIVFAYRGSLAESGEVFEDRTDSPMQIIAGRGQVMRALENELMDMEIGEERTVELAAKDAYGEYNMDALQHVPTYKIPNGENMPVGRYIGWKSPRNLEPIPVKVLEIENQIATLDFNHPLAGKDLVYWVKVTNIFD